MKRCLIVAGLLCVPFAFGPALAGRNSTKEETKEALQEFNDFIGQWNGRGNSVENRFIGWRESADWSWRFKGKDLWLRMKISKGKHFRGGELRWLSKQEKYEFTLIDKDKKKTVFIGAMRGKRLVLERIDPKTKAAQKIEMNNAADGVRFVYTFHERPENRTVFYKRFQVGFTKEGESFATAKRKVECVVTGGLGTIPVQFGGVTYYVCCSGCRDAFNADPAKIIAEYKKKRKKRRRN